MERNDRVSELFDDLIRESRPMGQQTEIVRPKVSKVPFGVNEAINALRGNIQLSGNNIKVVAVTSALAHEGKSSISFRLAKSLADLEKRVLFLDGDIRNSTMQVRYDILGDKVGLSEYLCGEASKDKIIYHTDDQWMDVIFTGAKAPNPSALISGPLFQELLHFLRSVYDYVIVDTPPLNPVIDGLMIAKQCDGTVMVVESGLTERKQAERARRQLEYANINILGAVLNKVQVSERRYGYGYGYGYGSKYGYGYGYGYGESAQDGDSSRRSGVSRKKKNAGSKKR